MKKIIFFLLSILNVAIISAQEQCLTTAPEPPQWIFNKSTRSLLTSTSYSMNIFVHIVRSSSGQGFGTGILSTIVNSLNSNFQDADIQFSLLGSEFIDNDYYYVNFSGKENQLFGINAHCNAIDIYVLGQSTSWNGAGLVEDIPSTALIVHGNYYNTSTLPHEMGHCIGLYHTHHGTVNEGGGDINQCPELVNGSNSTVCGDYISDTHADPNQWSSNSCIYTGTGIDANGDQYYPEASNLMSYAYKPCRNLFSELQIGRMKDFIDNTTILQNVFHSIISGPSVVCSSGASFTISNLPPVDSIIWSTGSKLTVNSGQNTDSTTIKATGRGSSWVRARLVTECGSITLPEKNVWAGLPNAPNNITRFSNNGKKFAINSYYEFYVIPQPGATYFTWNVSGGTITEGQGTSFVLVRTASYPTNFSLSVKAGNDCGESSYFTRTGFVVDEDLPIDAIPPDETTAETDSPENNLQALKQGSIPATYKITIAPNPTSGETTLTIETNSAEKTFDETDQWDLEVYLGTHQLKTKQTGLLGQSAKLQTAGWKEGVYIVRVKYKDEILTGKLVVKK